MRPTENEGRPTPHGGGNGIGREVVLGLISRGERLAAELAPQVSAIHAYDLTAALTYVKNGEILPRHQE